jgi:multicomponent Na+:H+ antiporter subunit B
MTEAAVGAGVSTVLFLAALISVGIHTPPRSIKRVLLPLIVVLITGTALVYILEDMPSYGDAHAPPHTHVVPYYLQQTQADIDIPNIVTAILADYRGYDTLGETAVVFLAAISVLLLLSDNKENTEDEADE